MTHSFTITDLRLPAFIIALIVALLLYASITAQPIDPLGWNAPRLNSRTATPTQASTGWWQDFPSPAESVTLTPTPTQKGTPDVYSQSTVHQ